MVNDALPLFLVEGPNWTCEVEIDEMNVLFSHEEQAYEAATKAIEAIKGLTENHTLELKKGSDEPPYMGLATFAFLKGTDPDTTGVYIPSYIALANCGFYRDSAIVKENFIRHIEQIQKEDSAKSSSLKKDIQAYSKNLKTPKSPKKPSKKRDKKKKK